MKTNPKHSRSVLQVPFVVRGSGFCNLPFKSTGVEYIAPYPSNLYLLRLVPYKPRLDLTAVSLETSILKDFLVLLYAFTVYYFVVIVRSRLQQSLQLLIKWLLGLLVEFSVGLC